jgi:hypothetical protein
MRTDRQTDVKKLIKAFLNFANASKHSEYFDTHYEVSAYESKGFIVYYNRDIVSGEIYNRYFFNTNTKRVQSTLHGAR